MVGKMWPALKSCKHQCYKANDQLNQLSDDLLFLIMSFLTRNEAVRTSVLSHRWNIMWRYFPVLIFEDYPAMKRMLKDEKSIPHERSNFSRWVNQVLEANLGQSINELKFLVFNGMPFRKIVRRNGRSLRSLQTLKLCGNIGLPIDLEIATYVFENSIMLKDVIVEIKPLAPSLSGDVRVRDQVANLERIVPQGVKLTLMVLDIFSDH